MCEEKRWREEIITTTGRLGEVPYSRFHDGTIHCSKYACCVYNNICI